MNECANTRNQEIEIILNLSSLCYQIMCFLYDDGHKREVKQCIDIYDGRNDRMSPGTVDREWLDCQRQISNGTPVSREQFIKGAGHLDRVM